MNLLHFFLSPEQKAKMFLLGLHLDGRTPYVLGAIFFTATRCAVISDFHSNSAKTSDLVCDTDSTFTKQKKRRV